MPFTAHPNVVYSATDFVREAQHMAVVRDLNNYAMAYMNNGDYTTAENLYKLILAARDAHDGPTAVTTSFTRDALGRVQLKRGKLDEAETNLRVAVAIQNAGDRHSLDAAASRDNLARVLETKGKHVEAKEIRLSVSGSMVCGYPECWSGTHRVANLQRCTKCECIFYCSEGCQASDWTGRHEFTCKVE